MDKSIYSFSGDNSYQESTETLIRGIIDAYKECPCAENKTFEEVSEWAGRHVLIGEVK